MVFSNKTSMVIDKIVNKHQSMLLLTMMEMAIQLFINGMETILTILDILEMDGLKLDKVVFKHVTILLKV